MKKKKYRPCEIIKKINDNAYVVDLLDNLAISSTFNVADLFEYFLPKDSGSNLRTSYFQKGETEVGCLPGENYLPIQGEKFLPVPSLYREKILLSLF